jgi:hypothetical protein
LLGGEPGDVGEPDACLDSGGTADGQGEASQFAGGELAAQRGKGFIDPADGPALAQREPLGVGAGFEGEAAAVLRRQATVLRAGGLVVPIELDIRTARALPATPLASQAVAWLAEASGKGGIQPSLGARLWAILREAVLRPLGMLGIQPHFGPGDPAAAALLAGIIRTAAPLIERIGVATAEEIGVQTFAQRLTGELHMNSAVFAHPLLLSAWGTAGPA